MFEFLKNMWIMSRIDEEYLQKRVEKGQITEEEYKQIITNEKL